MIEPAAARQQKQRSARVFFAGSFSLSHLASLFLPLQTSSEITDWYLYRFGSYAGYGFMENYLTSRIYKFFGEVTDLRKTKIYKAFKAPPAVWHCACKQFVCRENRVGIALILEQ